MNAQYLRELAEAVNAEKDLAAEPAILSEISIIYLRAEAAAKRGKFSIDKWLDGSDDGHAHEIVRRLERAGFSVIGVHGCRDGNRYSHLVRVSWDAPVILERFHD